MKRIYISGPISKGCIRTNVQQADAAMLVLMRVGHAPFNPMLSCYAGGQENVEFGCLVPPDAKAHGSFREVPHAAWIGMDLAWVEVSHAVLRLPGESTGADMETAHARLLGIPVFDDLTKLLEWASPGPPPDAPGSPAVLPRPRPTQPVPHYMPEQFPLAAA